MNKKFILDLLIVQVKIVECIHGRDSAVYQAIMSFIKFEYMSQIITNIFMLRFYSLQLIKILQSY